MHVRRHLLHSHCCYAGPYLWVSHYIRVLRVMDIRTDIMMCRY
jgi:hypothetical protein